MELEEIEQGKHYQDPDIYIKHLSKKNGKLRAEVTFYQTYY